MSVSPSAAGAASSVRPATDILAQIGNTPLVAAANASRATSRASRSTARPSTSIPAARSRIGPRSEHDPGRRAHRQAEARRHHPRRHQRQHRHRLRHDRGRPRLQGQALPAGQRFHGAQAHPEGLWRGDGLHRSGRRLGRRDPQGAGDLQRRSGRYFYPDQYNNPANWQAHFNTTGPEIIEQTDGRITHFVASLGTSGTFMGTTRRLRAGPAARRMHLGAAVVRVSTASKA